MSGEWNPLGNTILGKTGDLLGSSVSLSSDGTIVAIGAFAAVGGVGVVRVYQYKGNWTQLGSDINGKASSMLPDFSGISVSLSSDGKIVAIGAPGTVKGYVSVYQYKRGNWTQLGSDINGKAAGDFSGTSVSLSSDGKIVAIGAIGNDDNGNNSGHVLVYQYEGGNWTQLGHDINGKAEDNSGWSVSLSSDGKIVAIETFRSLVYVYQYEGENWTQLGGDINGGLIRSSFRSLSLNRNGKETIVAQGLSTGGDDSRGLVRMYKLKLPGCTDRIASNYNELVTEDDNSCDYTNININEVKATVEAAITANDFIENSGIISLSEARTIFSVDLDPYPISKAKYRGAYLGQLVNNVGINGRVKVDANILDLNSINGVVVVVRTENEGTIDMGTVGIDEAVYIPVEDEQISIKIKLKSGEVVRCRKYQDTYRITIGDVITTLYTGEKMEILDGNGSREIIVGSVVVTPVISILGCMDESAKNYNASATTDDDSCEYEESDICFYAGSMVKTDKGYKAIEEIDVKKDRIDGKEIMIWTKTKNIEDEIIVMKEGSLSEGVPNRETRITEQHKIYNEGEWEEARSLEERNENIYRERYDGSYVYNIGLKEHGEMEVNGMIVETLNPLSRISRRMILRKKERKMRRLMGNRKV